MNHVWLDPALARFSIGPAREGCGLQQFRPQNDTERLKGLPYLAKADGDCLCTSIEPDLGPISSR